MLERMGTSLFVTIAVMTVIVAITAGLFARGRSSRALLAGIGFTLLPLGLFLTGMSDLLVSGIESLIAWVDRTGWTNTMSWGAGIGGLGILLLVVARFLPGPKPREERGDGATRKRPVGKQSTTKPAVGKGPQHTGQPSHPGPQSGAAPQKGAAGAGEVDLDEIEALLKKRGIV